MTARELVDKAIDVAKNYKTTYIWGGIGSPITESTIRQAERHYAKNKYNGYAAAARKLIGTPKAFYFDCVGLIKSLLWGWDGDRTQSYGGAKYGTNGVPDINADAMINRCDDVSTDFSYLEIGEALWCSGHIGIYIGDGFGVECTPAWQSGVQISAVGNLGRKAGYPTRMWVKHGKLPYVTYEQMEEEDMTVERFTELFREMRESLKDNDNAEWSADARNWATSIGLIAGGDELPNGDPNYMWEDMLTREQFVTVLYRFARLIGEA
ncbi:MAG: hypothetical protein PUF04_09320 [bacterium]|nr:hypothetical protein [bacterium]